MNIILATSRPWNLFMKACIEDAFDANVISFTAKDEFSFEKVKEINPDWIFVPHWSYIIPKEIHQNYNVVIFHMTDLPFGRGGSPLQNLILRGLKSTKLSAIRCESGLDTGDIYLQRVLSLEGSAREIFSRASGLTLEMIIEILKFNPRPVPQSGVVVNFERRKPHESNLVSAGTIEQIYDYIRMLDADGYPHAYLETEGFKFEFTDAQIINGELVAKVKIRNKE